MTFEIYSTNIYDPDELIEGYPCLKKYNFETKEIPCTSIIQIKDENNKTKFQEIPWVRKEAYITIDSLSDLCSLGNDVDNELIIETRTDKYNHLIIEIYDGYRE